MPVYDRAHWQRVTARMVPGNISGTLKRIVESQSQVVTLGLVDTLDEQMVLEQLLEAAKPPLPAATAKRFDYLLSAPWRYPPLRWGSRFGSRFEPSIFYGSLDEEALFAEAAWYRWVFVAGLTIPFGQRVVSQHTTFEARFSTASGCNLTKPPFAKHRAALTHRSDYHATQQLGALLRDKAIEAFVYFSARSRDTALNVALLSPRALRSRKHQNPQQWLCEMQPDRVSFRSENRLLTFMRSEFLADGELPVAPTT